MSPFVSRSLGDVIAEVMMSNTVFGGGYLLVEGPTDSSFFRSRASQHSCQIVICGAKSMVVNASRQVKLQCGSNALGVIDDDFDSALSIAYSCDDLVATDTHDLETLMLSSPALNSVILEYADAAKVAALESMEGMKFVDCLINRASAFGRLRYLNTIHGYSVSFENFSPWKFIDHKSWKLDQVKLLNEFANQSGQSLSQINSMYLSVSGIPSWNLIQGHDVVEILAIAFCNLIKSRKSMCHEDICSALRLSFYPALFQGTTLYRGIRQWESRNSQPLLN